MGRDKALLALEGMTLLQRALRTSAAISPDVWIVGQSSKYSEFGPTIEDIHCGLGPLGGIHAALTKSKRELNLILAVDMPPRLFRSSELFDRRSKSGRGSSNHPRSRHSLAAPMRRLSSRIFACD